MGSFGSLSWYAKVREGSGEGLNLVVVVAIVGDSVHKMLQQEEGSRGLSAAERSMADGKRSTYRNTPHDEVYETRWILSLTITDTLPLSQYLDSLYCKSREVERENDQTPLRVHLSFVLAVRDPKHPNRMQSRQKHEPIASETKFPGFVITHKDCGVIQSNAVPSVLPRTCFYNLSQFLSDPIRIHLDQFFQA